MNPGALSQEDEAFCAEQRRRLRALLGLPNTSSLEAPMPVPNDPPGPLAVRQSGIEAQASAAALLAHYNTLEERLAGELAAISEQLADARSNRDRVQRQLTEITVCLAELEAAMDAESGWRGDDA